MAILPLLPLKFAEKPGPSTTNKLVEVHVYSAPVSSLTTVTEVPIGMSFNVLNPEVFVQLDSLIDIFGEPVKLAIFTP